MTKHSELTRIEDEAADWVILLTDDPDNKKQLQQFRKWVSASALHTRIWKCTHRAYEGLSKLPPATQEHWPTGTVNTQGQDHKKQDTDSQEGLSPHLRETRTLGKAGWGERLTLGSMNWKTSIASLAMAACLLLVLLPNLTLRLTADYVTATGEQQTHALQDGSTLTLAPESAIDIRFTDGERQVRLLKGAAFFEVQRDIERPFVVSAGETRTTVLGTTFNIDMSDIGTVVSVAHGQVRVEDYSVTPAVSEDLLAGEQIEVTWGEGSSLSRIRLDDVARWRKGELIARNLTVTEVVDSFRRYYGGAIFVTEPFASQRVTGLYRLNDPASTLTDMAEAHGANARQVSPWLLVLSQ